MPKAARKLTKSRLDELREEIEADRRMSVFLSDGAQPGLYVMAWPVRVRFVFEYQPPAVGRRRRMQDVR